MLKQAVVSARVSMSNRASAGEVQNVRSALVCEPRCELAAIHPNDVRLGRDWEKSREKDRAIVASAGRPPGRTSHRRVYARDAPHQRPTGAEAQVALVGGLATCFQDAHCGSR